MPKTVLENDEVDAFKKAAKEMLALSDKQIAELIDKGHLTEVKQDEEISQ
ncbi:MAG: hypothetical protein HC862_17000 [Scytonema sp. RU_4_4]|nr:hypothetical protein [Scytonema sp. RU_4_4]NJR75985.1 hypothetical protein [Scytonema sp. CRU_2_7]